MKRIMFLILALFVASIGFAVSPTHMPSGLSTYANDTEIEADSTTATGAPDYGDMWVKGNLNVKGYINSLSESKSYPGFFTEEETFTNIPVASSGCLRTGALYGGLGGCVISTNVLVSGTSNYRDTFAFRLSTAGAQNICTSFDMVFDSNYATGIFKFSGIGADMVTREESLAVLSGTKTWSTYSYWWIQQSTLTVTTCAGMRGEPSGSLIAYDDSAKLYPRYGTGINIGLRNHPIGNTVAWVMEDSTAKVPSTAVVISSIACIQFPTAPTGLNYKLIRYRVRGNR